MRTDRHGATRCECSRGACLGLARTPRRHPGVVSRQRRGGMGYVPDHRARVRPRFLEPEGASDSISPVAAIGVLTALRAAGAHRFLANDISVVAPDFPEIAGHRQLSDALLLTLVRRSDMRLVTFDTG